MLFSSKNAFFSCCSMAVIHACDGRRTRCMVAVVHIERRPSYLVVTAYQHKRYVFIILQLSNTKKASSVWWKLSACLDIVFLFCYLLYLKTLLRLRHTFFFNLKGFCSSFFILLRFLCKGVAFPFKSFLLVPLFSVLLTSYRPNLHQQRGGRLVRMPSAFLR